MRWTTTRHNAQFLVAAGAARCIADRISPRNCWPRAGAAVPGSHGAARDGRGRAGVAHPDAAGELLRSCLAAEAAA
jgi:UDP-N-acetylglucosamine:LPS N-acetylglucosamine transferase